MSVASTAAPRPGPAPAATPDVPGFEIGVLLGSGGMGRVYRARDVESGREVALKWLDANAGDELRNRFQREAKAASGLRHPNIVGVFGSGRTNTGDFIVMELVEGFPLSVAFDARALGAAAVAEVGAKIARALEAAHAAGVVHRDVKPGNILLDAASQPRLVDFGLARFVSEKNALTGPQAIMGTLAYMSPEVARGGAADAGPASDVFSLGCVLYEGLSGTPPFLGERVQDTLQLIEQSSPVPLPPLVPPAVAALVFEALAKKPGQRPTARAIAERLEALSVPIASTATPAAPRLTHLQVGLATRPLSQASAAPPVVRPTAPGPAGLVPPTRAAGAPAPGSRPVGSPVPATRPAPAAKPALTDSQLPPQSEGRQAILLVGGLFLALAFASLVAFAWGRRPAALPGPEPEAIASPSPAGGRPTTQPAPVPPVSATGPSPAPVAVEPAAPDAADELAGLDLMPAEPETMPSPAPSPSPGVAPSGNATPAPRPTPNVIEDDLKALKQAAMTGEHETTIRLANKLLVEVPASEKALIAQVYAALGRAQVFVGTMNEAEQAYTRALDRDPDNQNALYGHVALALLEKNPDLAQKRLKALTDRKPGSTAAMTARAMIQAVGAGRPGTKLLDLAACFDKPLTRHTLRVATGKR